MAGPPPNSKSRHDAHGKASRTAKIERVVHHAASMQLCLVPGQEAGVAHGASLQEHKHRKEGGQGKADAADDDVGDAEEVICAAQERCEPWSSHDSRRSCATSSA
jgi:hypothetical protein